MLAREFNKRRIELDIKKAFKNRELDDIKDAFKFVNDSKDTSRIKTADLAKFLNLFNLDYTEADLQNSMNEFSDDGWIYYTQVLVVMARNRGLMESEDELVQAFNIFDNDKDGLVGKGDLKNLLESLGESLSNIGKLSYILTAGII